MDELGRQPANFLDNIKIIVFYYTQFTIFNLYYYVKKRRSRNNRPKRARNWFERKPDMIYFEGVVIETLPGVKFKVKVDRGEKLEPLIIPVDLRTFLKVKRVKIIKGDKVWIELDPTKSFDHGVIVSRI